MITIFQLLMMVFVAMCIWGIVGHKDSGGYVPDLVGPLWFVCGIIGMLLLIAYKLGGIFAC